MKYTADQFSVILEEIAAFEVELAEDPTLPDLGVRYLNSRVALCRKYLNRVIYYMQTIGKQVKELTVETRQMELDLELKLAQKLADDPEVRKQPSIEDRKALATMLLRPEHDNLSALRLELLDAAETYKIVKLKHQDLIRTNADVKSQRQLVRDDADAQMAGQHGYSKPQARQDRSVPDGMPPPVSPGAIDPKDLLDPEKRPADMPEPMDEMHAQQIADFFSSKPPQDQIKDRAVIGPRDSAQQEPVRKPAYDDDVVEPVAPMLFDDV
jgi:hypothetical protein